MYVSRVKWGNQGKGVVPSSTLRCCSYWKASLRVALDYGRKPYNLYVFTNPFAWGGCDTRSHLLAEFNRFGFWVFLLLDKLPNQSWRNQSDLLFSHTCKENTRIHTFPRGISALWNASPKIWTRVAVFIYFGDNHCPAGISLQLMSFSLLNAAITFQRMADDILWDWLYVCVRRWCFDIF